MKKEKTQKLFTEDEPIVVNEIVFPLYYKNKISTIYTCLKTEDKFEQLTISPDGLSFRGDILFGFNEQLKSIKGDIQLLYNSIVNNQVLIDQTEYESVFNQLIQGRDEFFTESKYKYIEPIQDLTQEQLSKYIKHKWKPLR